MLDFYHFKRESILNVSSWKFSAKIYEIFQISFAWWRHLFNSRNIYIYMWTGYIEKRFLWKDIKRRLAGHPLSVSQTAFVLNRPAQFVERSASSCPSVRTPGTPNYLSHVTVVQAWFRRNNLIWNERLYII